LSVRLQVMIYGFWLPRRYLPNFLFRGGHATC